VAVVVVFGRGGGLAGHGVRDCNSKPVIAVIVVMVERRADQLKNQHQDQQPTHEPAGTACAVAGATRAR